MINPFKNKKGLGRGLSSLIGDSDIKNSNNILPSWDQGYHLSNLIKVQNILSSYSINFLTKFNYLLVMIIERFCNDVAFQI